MKKIILVFLTLLLMSSCEVFGIYSNRSYPDYEEQMQLLKSSFPELYVLYCNGSIVINEIFEYDASDGTRKVHVNYRYRTTTTNNYYSY